MAQGPPERPEKAQLIAEIEQSREALGNDLRSLGRAVDVPVKIGRHLSSAPVRVAAGSAIAALAASLLFGKKSESRSSTGGSSVFGPLIKQLGDFAKSQIPESGDAGKEPDLGRIAKAFWQTFK